jgi:PPK2 family polyphosphate:nucleotide phosphotransferase
MGSDKKKSKSCIADFDTSSLIYDGDKRFSINDAPNVIEPVYHSKKNYRKQLAAMVSKIDERQEIMHAQNTHGLLLVFQAMDAAGKDGTIKRVLTGVNPAGVQVYSFKKPSDEELDHGYLWRVIQRMPERGRIGVFNRSYYEEVLVVRVHPEILTKYQRIPRKLVKDTDKVFESRFEQIENFEKYVTDNGFKVIKFFLNVSYEEQGRRLLARLNNPEKHWKFSFSDIDERAHWSDYMTAFEDCINATACKNAPWAVVPADDKLNMRLLVTKIVLEQMQSMDLDWPDADERLEAEIGNMRELLSA